MEIKNILLALVVGAQPYVILAAENCKVCQETPKQILDIEQQQIEKIQIMFQEISSIGSDALLAAHWAADQVVNIYANYEAFMKGESEKGQNAAEAASNAAGEAVSSAVASSTYQAVFGENFVESTYVNEDIYTCIYNYAAKASIDSIDGNANITPEEVGVVAACAAWKRTAALYSNKYLTKQWDRSKLRKFESGQSAAITFRAALNKLEDYKKNSNVEKMIPEVKTLLDGAISTLDHEIALLENDTLTGQHFLRSFGKSPIPMLVKKAYKDLAKSPICGAKNPLIPYKWLTAS